MKTSVASLLLVTSLLFACSSDDKKSPGGGAQNANPSTCPNFDGVFTRKIDDENSRSIEIHTKQEDGFFQYSFGRESSFLKADGQELDMQMEGKEGKIKVSCDQNSVTVLAQEEEGPMTSLIYRSVGTNQIKVETNGGDLAPMDGIYTKE